MCAQQMPRTVVEAVPPELERDELFLAVAAAEQEAPVVVELQEQIVWKWVEVVRPHDVVCMLSQLSGCHCSHFSLPSLSRDGRR